VAAEYNPQNRTDDQIHTIVSDEMERVGDSLRSRRPCGLRAERASCERLRIEPRLQVCVCWSIRWRTFFPRRVPSHALWAHPVPKLRMVVVVEYHLSALLCGMHATFPEHNPSFDPVTQVAFRPIQDGGSVIGSQDSGDYRNQAQPCGAGAHAHKPSHAVR